MAKGIYVGVNSEVTSEELTDFTSSIAPISWNGSDDGKTGTATNDYGEWTAVVTNVGVYSTSNPVVSAFDDSTSTYYRSNLLSSVNVPAIINLSTPEDISIKPKTITIKYANCDNISAIQGVKSDGTTAVLVSELTGSSSAKTETFTISTDEYFVKFQAVLRVYENNASVSLYDFKVSSGTVKKISYTNASVAHKVKKAYVGVDSKLPNLVVNGDFSNGLEGWTPLYKNYLTASVFEDGYQEKCVSLETIEDKTYSYNMFINYLTNYTFIENHIYYASVYVKSDIEKQIRICTNSENNEGDRYWLIYKEFTANTSWQKISGLGTSEGNSNEGYVAVDFQGAPKNTFYVDCFELYDLTEIFGAGNEPTQEWCDANLDATIGKGIARKVKKGYIGVGGVAQLFYSLATLVPFSSSRAPINWTDSGNGKTATATNSYGEWKITASQIQDADSYNTIHAFDNSTYSYWHSGNLSSDSTFVWCGIYLPEGVSINPKKFSLKYAKFRNAHIQGLNETTEAWENIVSLTDTSSTLSVTPGVTTNNYYKAFRVAGYRYSSTYKNPALDSFLITAGTLKIE